MDIFFQLNCLRIFNLAWHEIYDNVEKHCCVGRNAMQWVDIDDGSFIEVYKSCLQTGCWVLRNRCCEGLDVSEFFRLLIGGINWRRLLPRMGKSEMIKWRKEKSKGRINGWIVVSGQGKEEFKFIKYEKNWDKMETDQHRWLRSTSKTLGSNYRGHSPCLARYALRGPGLKLSKKLRFWRYWGLQVPLYKLSRLRVLQFMKELESHVNLFT